MKAYLFICAALYFILTEILMRISALFPLSNVSFQADSQEENTHVASRSALSSSETLSFLPAKGIRSDQI